MTETLTGRTETRGRPRLHKLTDAMQKRIRDLHDQGKFRKEIAVIVGKPLDTIAEFLAGVKSPEGDAKRALARKRLALAGYATTAVRVSGVARPPAVVSPPFTDEWYEENHASFVAGMRAAYPGIAEFPGTNPFNGGGA